MRDGGPASPGLSALLRARRGPEDNRMQIDLLTALVVTVGVAVAVFLAVLAGKLSARVFFDASGRKVDEDRP